MTNDFTSLSNIPNLTNTLKTSQDYLLYNKLNCVRVGIVDEFYPNEKKVKVYIANKVTVGLNKDGTQIVEDYPPIFAKVHYLGWGDIGITYPITKGMEGILLFNDREIESWYLNGQINPVAHNRCHSLSDALFICGVHSMPNMIELVADCLNIFYKNTFIRLLENTISIKGDTTLEGNLTQTGNYAQTGNITQTGSITSSGTITGASLNAGDGASGTFMSDDGKTITVVNGIVTGIS